MGSRLHKMSGQDFFREACLQADSEGAKVYLYGLLAHYCLDSVCHPFVHKMVNTGQAGHVLLESEFDRFLMERDGIPSPHTWDITGHMKLTRGECLTAAQFFPPATPGNIRQSLRYMGLSIRLLALKNRTLVEGFVKRTTPAYLDNMIPAEPVEAYARMDSELLARFERCVRRYPAMLEQLCRHMAEGEPLGEDFAPTFG